MLEITIQEAKALLGNLIPYQAKAIHIGELWVVWHDPYCKRLDCQMVGYHANPDGS